MAFANPAPQLKNLFLVSDARKSWKDFEEIGREILAIAKDVSVHIVPMGLDPRAVPPRVWAHPSLTVTLIVYSSVASSKKTLVSMTWKSA